MQARGCLLLWLSPFLVLSITFIVWGFIADPEALTDDGYPLKPVLFFMGGSFLFFPLLTWLAGFLKQRRLEELMQTGQQGQAVILSLEDTGVRIDDEPRVRLVLEVHVEGNAPYRVEKTTVVPLIRLPQVQVGSTVQVMADPKEPDNPNKIALLLK